MRRALLISVLLIIVLVAAWAVRELSDQPAVISTPEPIANVDPTPTPAPLAIATPIPTPSAPSPVPTAQPDAAPTQTAAHDVQFDLLDERLVADVGTRLTLRNGKEEVSGLVDVAGVARLPLSDGLWTVIAPTRTFPPQFEVTAATQRMQLVRLESKDLAITGVVVDERGLPVPSATVTDGVHKVVTDTSGEFQFLVPGESAVAITASSGEKRSRPVRAVGPNASVRLKLESTVEYEVEVTGPGATTALGLVFTDQVLTCKEFPCTVQVLRGNVRLLVTSFNAGVLFVARKNEQIEGDKKHTARLVLKPAPLFRGTVVDARTSAPIPGVDVRLVPWPAPPTAAAAGSAMQSSTAGLVASAWPSNAQFFNVLVGPLYRVDKEIIVSPGDAPITISVAQIQ
ncbi:MAG: hypothetical protein QM817_32960 [Archangium sp.]